MIIINPEFHRHLWLNFSVFKIIITPTILALIIYLLSNFDAHTPWQTTILQPVFWTCLIVIFIWGNFEAASSAVADTGLKTWDFQKMSAISPWELVIGKLFGATSYVWYTAIFLLITLVFSHHFTDNLASLKSTPISHLPPLKLATYLVLSGIMGHATALLLSIDILQRRGKPYAAVSFICGFLVSSFTLLVTLALEGGGSSHNIHIKWHNLTLDHHVFIIGSLAYFLFWVILAIERNLRSELQYKNSPFILMAFLVTLCLYFSGILNNIPNLNILVLTERISWRDILIGKVLLSFSILLPCTYLCLFVASCNLAKYKRWIFALKNQEWKRALENTPGWVGCLLLLLPVYIGANALVINRISDQSTPFLFLYLTTALLLFMARDGLICHSIFSGKIKRHRSYMVILYYVLAYVLLPLTVVSFLKAGSDVYNQTMSVFYPMGGPSFYQACLPIILQVITASVIFYLSLKPKETASPPL